MNECRPLTAEELSALSDVIQRLELSAPDSVMRFVDSRLNKLYDTYLITRSGGQAVLKKCDARLQDLTKYQQYFAGHDFAAPRIDDSFSCGENAYVLMEYIQGSDARGCAPQDAARIGQELARIQSHYLMPGSLTPAADRYYTRYVASSASKIKDYAEGIDLVMPLVRRRFVQAPHSLIHDDLLPINVILNEQGPWIIDWETAEILPYFLDLARFAFVCNAQGEFYISPEAGLSFLDAYDAQMRRNPYFAMDHAQFRQDVAISAFCQYVMFLAHEKDAQRLHSTVYDRYFREIMNYLLQAA